MLSFTNIEATTKSRRLWSSYHGMPQEQGANSVQDSVPKANLEFSVDHPIRRFPPVSFQTQKAHSPSAATPQSAQTPAHCVPLSAFLFARSRVPLPVPPIKVKPLSQLLAFKRILSPGFKASPGTTWGRRFRITSFTTTLPTSLAITIPFSSISAFAVLTLSAALVITPVCPRHANCRCPILHRHPSSRQNSSHRHLHPILTLQLRNLTSLCHSSPAGLWCCAQSRRE